MKFFSPALYAITDRALFSALDAPAYLELLFRTRAHVVQLREKDMALEELRELAGLGLRLARSFNKTFLINSRLDLALELGAGGVHLTSGQSVAEAVGARAKQGSAEFAIGKSVHSLEEAFQAQREGADYIMLGPVFDPLSKAARRRPLGLEGLRQAVEALRIPVAAVGGLEGDRLERVFAAGAWAAAGISWPRPEIQRLLRSERSPSP